MRIRCPECNFERDIDTTKIPASATVATCPRCSHRFRFRDPETGASVLEMAAQAQKLSPSNDATPSTLETPVAHPVLHDAESIPMSSAASSGQSAPSHPTQHPTDPAHPDDDPLPPGAIIPRLDDQSEAQPGNLADTQPVNQTDNNSLHNQGSDPQNGAASSSEAQQVANNGKRPPWLKPNQADQDSPATADGFNGVPWEHPELFGFLGSLLHTVLRVMFRAPEFFRNIRSNTPLNKAIVFFLLMSVMDVLIYRMWAINALQSLSETVTDPAMLSSIQEMVPSSGGDILTLLLFTPFIALFRLFFFAGLYHVMIRLVQPDKADFPTVTRVIAYSSASFVLSIVPVVGSLLGSLWFVASTFIGCKFALNLSWSKVTLALLPLFLLAGAVVLQVSRILMAGMAGI